MLSKRREVKVLSIIEEIRDLPQSFECDCGGKMEIKNETVDLVGITVTDLPVYVCERCGEKEINLYLTASIEALRDKKGLHGKYTMKDLLSLR